VGWNIQQEDKNRCWNGWNEATAGVDVDSKINAWGWNQGYWERWSVIVSCGVSSIGTWRTPISLFMLKIVPNLNLSVIESLFRKNRQKCIEIQIIIRVAGGSLFRWTHKDIFLIKQIIKSWSQYFLKTLAYQASKTIIIWRTRCFDICVYKPKKARLTCL